MLFFLIFIKEKHNMFGSYIFKNPHINNYHICIVKFDIKIFQDLALKN